MKAETPRRDEHTTTVALLGVPWDEHSSFTRGPSLAPPAIRAALRSPSTNLSTESGLDLGTDPRFTDAGDLEIPAGAGALETIERGIARVLASGSRVLALGGDHAVSYPLLRAHASHHSGLTLVHLDAHPDLYDEFEGDRLSHACPFARILEERLVRRLVQVGIRTLNAPQRAQAERFGVERIEMKDWRPGLALDTDGPVYVSIDLDVLDPAFAPGVSHPEPGGPSPRDVIGFLQRLRGRVVGADVVELNPSRDPEGLTARVAAKLVKELAARLLSDQDPT
jgi:arginase